MWVRARAISHQSFLQQNCTLISTGPHVSQDQQTEMDRVSPRAAPSYPHREALQTT